jgi:hypothetical protein
MENIETPDIINELDCSWINEFEITENEYASFYKEKIDSIKINYIYIDKTNSVDNIHQENIIIEDGKMDKEKIIDVIKRNKKKNNIEYKLISILKYNITLEPEHIKDYINNDFNDDFLSKIDILQDIYFKDSINLFQDLNCLYIIFCDKTLRENKNKITKKVILSLMSKKRKKTKRTN